MTRDEAKDFLPIIEAFSKGKVIEYRLKGVNNDWEEIEDLFCPYEYRIKPKPKPKYRPYRNLKECFHDMKNHEPFGYVREKQKGDLELVIGTLDDEHEYLKLSVSSIRQLKTVFERYTYFDGSPFGVKLGNNYGLDRYRA